MHCISCLRNQATNLVHKALKASLHTPNIIYVVSSRVCRNLLCTSTGLALGDAGQLYEVCPAGEVVLLQGRLNQSANDRYRQVS